MGLRLLFLRGAVPAGLLAVMAGCATNTVAFTNVSDSWLSVRFYVSSPVGNNQFVSHRSFQVGPGQTTDFTVHRGTMPTGQSGLVHLQVQTVTPSWEPSEKQHWMELLAEGPIRIVARGRGDKLEFETGKGEVARIPSRELKKRFEHHVAGAVETPLP